MRRLVDIRPRRGARLLLGGLPILILLVVYLFASEMRHAANSADKVLPTFSAMGQAIQGFTTDRDPMTGRTTIVADTLASLYRLGLGLGIATVTALLLGLLLGVVPLARALLGPVIMVIAVIPPIAVLPILFIVLGLDEASKIALIAIGIGPFMTRDLAGFVAALPREQFAKAQTLGANSWQLALRVALPQLMPRLIEAVRLSIGPAWVFLIAAEAVASDVGLGYRIFLVRRYFAMDIILPYVAWISLLAIAADALLLLISRKGFAWAHGDGR
ncbi:NitT/TauT family transport system permease protein [Sphingomonas vulcanisoli]|uniref:NitT/TauT family transport system permease protein n=1 Tax=Sphingomonas vulcanisoli TaxID=1658060 RepID=A0ABX0TMK2_9SPHN|nr:NitT/TauT family transport system permease protein [Sphingomonas vulcanisoli]